MRSSAGRNTELADPEGERVFFSISLPHIGVQKAFGLVSAFIFG